QRRRGRRIRRRFLWGIAGRIWWGLRRWRRRWFRWWRRRWQWWGRCLRKLVRELSMSAPALIKEMTGWASLEGQWLRRKHFTADVLAAIRSEERRVGKEGRSLEWAARE